MTVDISEPAAPVAEVAAPSRALDVAVRVAGVVISLLLTVLTALLELFSTTLRVGGVLIWVSVPMAVLGSLGIAWFATTSTGRRWSVGPPWAVWTILMLFAAGTRTREGDYLLGPADYVALVTILAGSLTYAVVAYRMILRGNPDRAPATNL